MTSTAFGLPDYDRLRAEYVLARGRRPGGRRKKTTAVSHLPPDPLLDDYQMPTGALRKLTAVQILHPPASPGAVYLSTRDLASTLAPERLELALQDFDEDGFEEFDPYWEGWNKTGAKAPHWWPWVSLGALYAEVTEGEDYVPRETRFTRKRNTHCKHGHELSGDNLYTSPTGQRYCKTCDRRRGEKYRERRRAKLAM